MNVFVRIAGINGYMPNNFPTKAYDCRMLYILSGNSKIIIEGKEFPLKENTLCYYPPGTQYFPIANPDNPLFFVTLNFDFTREFQHINICLPPIRAENFQPQKAQNTHLECELDLFSEPFVMQDAHAFRDNVKKVAEEFERGNEGAASSLLQYVCYKLADSCRGKTDSLFEEIVDYVNLNYASIATNQDVAEALNYHPYYLNKVFREKKAITLHKYINEVRLNKSAELLRETDFSVSDISSAVGFNNADHFSKCFREEFGLSPTEFRKKNSHLNFI